MTSNAWTEVIVQSLEGGDGVDGYGNVGAALWDVGALADESEAQLAC